MDEELKILFKEVIKHQEANSALLLYIISNGQREKLKTLSELFEKLVSNKDEIWNFEFDNDKPASVN
jgi:hypothetical protein